MIGRITLAALAIAAAATPVLADYYAVREKSSNNCRVVETKPADTTTVTILGTTVFQTREEADTQLRVLCRDERSGGGSDRVIIEKRIEK
jgi:hypothetical protein